MWEYGGLETDFLYVNFSTSPRRRGHLSLLFAPSSILRCVCDILPAPALTPVHTQGHPPAGAECSSMSLWWHRGASGQATALLFVQARLLGMLGPQVGFASLPHYLAGMTSSLLVKATGFLPLRFMSIRRVFSAQHGCTPLSTALHGHVCAGCCGKSQATWGGQHIIHA